MDKRGKIYVSNFNDYNSNGFVSTYKPDGTRTTPTITTGIDGPAGLAVDANGKIYVVNVYNSTVTTYKPDGTPTTPTITTDLDSPAASPSTRTARSTLRTSSADLSNNGS